MNSLKWFFFAVSNFLKVIFTSKKGCKKLHKKLIKKLLTWYKKDVNINFVVDKKRQQKLYEMLVKIWLKKYEFFVDINHIKCYTE